jgi:CheY-like chemotaxis protein
MQQQLLQTKPTNRSKTAATQAALKGTCLIVEDSEFDSAKMSRIITKTLGGVKVTVAPTLGQARERLMQGDTNLILLDNNLPDGLGANFVQELARDPQLSQIPVIMVSDWPSPFMWQKAASAGVFYVVNKAEFDARYVHATLKMAQERRAKMN